MFQSIKKRLKDQRGLTLVELLAVVVILGIIAGIAVPSIGGIIEKTKKDAVVAEAIQIINAAKMSHATNSTNKSWGYTTRKYSAGPPVVEAVVGLEELLDNVTDKDFVVTYDSSTREYTIANHEASKVVNENGGTSAITEEHLLNHTK